MNKTYISSEESRKNFYPTPTKLVEKMLSDIDLNNHRTFLEPSCGTGAIIKEIAEMINKECELYRSGCNNQRENYEIDCIEIDPYIQSIFKYECLEKINNIKDEIQKLEQIKREWNSETREYKKLTEEQQIELNNLMDEKLHYFEDRTRLIHDDFLSFNSFKRYDAIIMNPPFENGDKHLLKAIELQKNGGYISCLLNAETIKNPCTNLRKVLIQQLKKYNASIEFLQDEFNTSETERKTDVEIALIKIDIPRIQPNSFIFEELKQSEEFKSKSVEVGDLTVTDFIQSIITQYNMEVKGTIKLIQEYKAFKPYMLNSIKSDDSYNSNNAILSLCIGDRASYNQAINENEYLKVVRMKYWTALFKNPKFTGKLTSNLQDKYNEMINELKNYDFTEFNIGKIQEQINKELVAGVEETILNLFDKLSEAHSWYPESQKNIHYYNGWKTNKAHKINKKVIMPIHGAFSSYSWRKDTFEVNTVYHVMNDIEKVFNYMNNGDIGLVDLHNALNYANTIGQTRNIELKYFKITLFKKGTCHIEFTNKELLDKLNIFGSRKKNWLPPNYGKATYTEMTQEEKTIVDEFQGKEEYSKVMTNPERYLYNPNSVLLLAEAI
jgi:hypothetical protein